MNEHTIKEDVLNILRVISSSENNLNQRDLSHSLGISLGKTNYLIKELVKKGLVKAKSFSSQAGKIGKIQYILTKRGMQEYLELTYDFLLRKEGEYLHLKEEWQKISLGTNGTKNNKQAKEGVSA